MINIIQLEGLDHVESIEFSIEYLFYITQILRKFLFRNVVVYNQPYQMPQDVFSLESKFNQFQICVT